MITISFSSPTESGFVYTTVKRSSECEKLDNPEDKIFSISTLISGVSAPANELRRLMSVVAPSGSSAFDWNLEGRARIASRFIVESPEGFDDSNGYYNEVYAGHVIAMPQPLYGEDVTYEDGTEATLEQEILDLVTFLTWTGQPELDERKSMGFRVFLFLIFMTTVLFLSYKKIWKIFNDTNDALPYD